MEAEEQNPGGDAECWRAAGDHGGMGVREGEKEHEEWGYILTLKRFGSMQKQWWKDIYFLVLRMHHAPPGWCFEKMLNGTIGENMGGKKI